MSTRQTDSHNDFRLFARTFAGKPKFSTNSFEIFSSYYFALLSYQFYFNGLFCMRKSNCNQLYAICSVYIRIK